MMLITEIADRLSKRVPIRLYGMFRLNGCDYDTDRDLLSYRRRYCTGQFAR